MFITVNDVRLYVDIEGAGLVADGRSMRAKPTLVLVHGGPGFDHSAFKPTFSALADIAQVIYYDHRGNGRSADGDRSGWTLAQWGDDVRGLCDALGIEKPIVLGVSFGGFVAQAYATRHPEHPAKLVLVSTAAKIDYPMIFAAFERLGGREARAIAEGYWTNPTAEGRARYLEHCFPLYRQRPADGAMVARALVRHDTALHFNGPANEHGRMDFRAALAGVRCPVLVMAGDSDPITPMPFSETIAACLPAHLVRFERFAACGHGVFGDEPDRALAVLRAFVQAAPP